MTLSTPLSHVTNSSNLDIVLASTSPRRQQLLSLADIEFITLAVDIDESQIQGETPQDYIERMVKSKALAACSELACKFDFHQITSSSQNSNHGPHSFKLVITADTIGVLPDRKSILVKPIDKTDAFVMWSHMSDNVHEVWTAVQLSLMDCTGNIINSKRILEKTEVTFITLTPQAMQDYWHSGEPQDKAGGYAIQGRGATWVQRINGSYTNVVGLPLSQTVAAINKMIASIGKQ